MPKNAFADVFRSTKTSFVNHHIRPGYREIWLEEGRVGRVFLRRDRMIFTNDV
jgi:hypothetical protein